MLRGGEGLTPDDDVQTLLALPKDEVARRFMADLCFGDTMLDFNMYFLGFKADSVKIDGGYAEVLDNVMTVLASAAEFAGEIDVARAQRAKERAEKRMGELNFEDPEYVQLEEAQRRALARLQVATKETSR